MNPTNILIHSPKSFLAMVLLLPAFFLLSSSPVAAQCVPDPSCIDIGDPGEICPEALSDGAIDVYYEQVVTIIPPDSAVILSNVIYLSAVQLSYINNIPPGLSFESNAANHLFPVGNKYCVKISGTPTQIGDFTLQIGVVPYIGGVPFTIGLTEDTTLSISIREELNTNNWSEEWSDFSVSPNPFHDAIWLNGIPPHQHQLIFELYDASGRLVYSENLNPSQNQASVSLSKLPLKQSFYMYRLIGNNTIRTGKLIRH